MPAAIVSLQKHNSFGGGRGQKKPFFMARQGGWGGDQNSQTCKWSVDGRGGGCCYEQKRVTKTELGVRDPN